MSKDTKHRENQHHGGPMGSMGRPVEKAKDFKGTIKRLLGYLKPNMTKLIIVLVFAVLSTIFAIRGPKILGNGTNKLFEGIMSKKAVAEMRVKEAQIDKLIKSAPSNSRHTFLI